MGRQNTGRKWQMRLIAGLAVCSVALSGCGGGDEEAADPDPITNTDAKTDAKTGGATTTTAASGTGSASGSGSGAGTGLLSATCQQGTQAFALAVGSISLVLSGQSNEKEFNDAIAKLSSVANDAPSEIRNDLKTLAAGYAAYAKGLKDAGYKPGVTPSAADLKAMEKASAELNKPEFEKASDKVTAWFDKECKG